MFKKGQITVFIIVGVILLLGLGIVLYVSTPSGDVLPDIQDAPEAARPVQTFVTGCLQDVTIDGIKRIGEHGGYLDSSGIDADRIDSTKGDGVYMESTSDFIIPYWYHMDSTNDCEKSNSCTFKNTHPPLTGPNSVETQLENYITQNLDSCLKDFDAFPNLQVNKLSKPEVDVFIGANIGVRLNYELEVIKGDNEYDLDAFYVPVELDLAEIYELAEQIVDAQAETNFFEKHMINLLALNSGTETSKLPPFGATELEYGSGKIWIKSKVKDDVQNHILLMTNLLRVHATLNGRPAETEGAMSDVRDVFLNRGMMLPVNKSYLDYVVNFDYLPWWEPYFNLNCDGEVCTSEGGNFNIMMMFGIQRYMFAYDLSYPVMVEIYNPFAFNDRGFSWRFFIESNIRNNEPLDSEYEELDLDIDLEPYKSMLCDMDKRTSEPVTISVTRENGKPIPDAHVSFIVGDESCAVGKTDESGTITTNLPIFIDGYLSAQKEDFTSGSTRISTADQPAQEATIILHPYFYIDASVRKVPIQKTGEFGKWKINMKTPKLYPRNKEEYMIILQKDVAPTEQSEVFFADIVGGDFTKTNPCDANPVQQTNENIRISPGTYKGQVIGLSYEDVYIPPRTTTTQQGFISTDIDMPEMTFGCENPLPITLGEFSWTVSEEDLKNKKEVVFYFLAWDIKGTPESFRTISDLSTLGWLGNATYEFQNTLRPQLI